VEFIGRRKRAVAAVSDADVRATSATHRPSGDTATSFGMPGVATRNRIGSALPFGRRPKIATITIATTTTAPANIAVRPDLEAAGRSASWPDALG
jgi:hypothetical protein